jgi:hypothetical protein
MAIKWAKMGRFWHENDERKKMFERQEVSKNTENRLKKTIKTPKNTINRVKKSQKHPKTPQKRHKKPQNVPKARTSSWYSHLARLSEALSTGSHSTARAKKARRGGVSRRSRGGLGGAKMGVLRGFEGVFDRKMGVFDGEMGVLRVFLMGKWVFWWENECFWVFLI